MEYDVLVVGAGPAGLAAAIRLLQCNSQLRVCVLEKGAYPGAHLLSGAVLNPRSLKALLPEDWQKLALTPVTKDGFYYLTEKHGFRVPTPKPMKNKGNYLVSLSKMGQFLANIAESLGCEIYPGFAAKEILMDKQGHVIGIRTNPVGLDREGQHTPHYQPGMELHAKYTLFAEGCRGQLSEQLMHQFQLRVAANPQTYALGIKELWQLPESAIHKTGSVTHTIGWPLNKATFGGSFIYHLPNQQLAIGLVVGLDYSNPWLDPFEEMQRFKTHPMIKPYFNNAERLEFGARALNEGGWQSQPHLTFPGGALIGDAAGFLNVSQIKGIHTAIESGMLAADACVEMLNQSNAYGQEAFSYTTKIKSSWVESELFRARNIRPGFRYGLAVGLCNAAFETYVSRGYSPWTLPHRCDHATLRPAHQSMPISYPKPDGVITFDRASSVYLSNTHHHENQPNHLYLNDETVPIHLNYAKYASPETRYCPAGVYEIVGDEQHKKLQINASNCIHCKTCDIKDPTQNIIWHVPEGGGGPNYRGL